MKKSRHCPQTNGSGKAAQSVQQKNLPLELRIRCALAKAEDLVLEPPSEYIHLIKDTDLWANIGLYRSSG